MIEHLREREKALEPLGWTGREAEWRSARIAAAKMLRKCLAIRFTSAIPFRNSWLLQSPFVQPFLQPTPFPSPRVSPDRSSPSRVRSAASRPGPLWTDLES